MIMELKSITIAELSKLLSKHKKKVVGPGVIKIS